MKALVYDKAHSLEEFAVKLAEISEPTLRELDVLVDVHAVGINPGETFIRRTRSAEPGGRVLLGWEFAGVIVETGSGVRGFKTSDRVFGTGDMTRDGAWAERVAVDHQILARTPVRCNCNVGFNAQGDDDWNCDQRCAASHDADHAREEEHSD
jgi:NADPH2:quinone reductase